MPDEPLNLLPGTIAGVNAVRRGSLLELTGIVVRLADGREIVADADSRATKFVRKRRILIGSSVEVEMRSEADRPRIVTFSGGP